MSQLQEGQYDIVLIMNADNVVDTNFLEVVNNTYASGSNAIQTHRIIDIPEDPLTVDIHAVRVQNLITSADAELLYDPRTDKDSKKSQQQICRQRPFY